MHTAAGQGWTRDSIGVQFVDIICSTNTLSIESQMTRFYQVDTCPKFKMATIFSFLILRQIHWSGKSQGILWWKPYFDIFIDKQEKSKN